MSEVKQVIVVRKDLNMRKGKIAAQVAHASLKVIVDMMRRDDMSYPVGTGMQEGVRLLMLLDKGSPAYEWLNGRFTKIVVYVDSEDELRDLYNKAFDKGLPCAFIVDSGFTEFHGNKTATCIAIGPYWSDKIDEITGDLPLL
jgi:PTH2 family peptidyl-tRNA hydrolase